MELSVCTLMCVNCTAAPTGAKSSAGAEAAQIIQRSNALVRRKCGRGGRSLEGTLRDFCRRKHRRTKKLDFGWTYEDPDEPDIVKFRGCVVERWARDVPRRTSMMSYAFTCEDCEEMDGMAETKCQDPSRKGEGRTRQ